MSERKKIAFHSNYHGQLTGFGKNCKNILSYLYSTGKYEIVELANGYRENDPIFQFSPWKVVGTINEDESFVRGIVDKICSNASSQEERKSLEEAGKRRIFYGDSNIEQILYREKPDFYISVEDIWAMSPYVDRSWWNKFPCAIWTTLDSLPILPDAIKCAQKTEHFYPWADFATQELNKIGLKHVKTIHGALKTSDFYRLSDKERKDLRVKNNLDFEYVAGFVFRNQQRKTVHCLFDAISDFKKRIKNVKIKALVVTNWSEGWPLPKLIADAGLSPEDVITPFVCSKCSDYKVLPFYSNAVDCNKCGGKQCCSTVSIVKGLSEKQLNEVYNLMDVYAHPFNSGGQEIPIQEAKLAELITLVTNYSCGTEGSDKESGGFPIKWHETREFGSCFKKAVSDPMDLSRQLEIVHLLPEAKKRQLGKTAREYVINNYSIESVGKKWEQIIDSIPKTSFWNSLKKPLKIDINYIPVSSDPALFVDEIYRNILGEEPDIRDPNYEDAINAIVNGQPKELILEEFKKEARNRISVKNNTVPNDCELICVKNGVIGAIKAKKLIDSGGTYHVFCGDYFKSALLSKNVTFVNSPDTISYKKVHDF